MLLLFAHEQSKPTDFVTHNVTSIEDFTLFTEKTYNEQNFKSVFISKKFLSSLSIPLRLRLILNAISFDVVVTDDTSISKEINTQVNDNLPYHYIKFSHDHNKNPLFHNGPLSEKLSRNEWYELRDFGKDEPGLTLYRDHDIKDISEQIIRLMLDSKNIIKEKAFFPNIWMNGFLNSVKEQIAEHGANYDSTLLRQLHLHYGKCIPNSVLILDTTVVELSDNDIIELLRSDEYDTYLLKHNINVHLNTDQNINYQGELTLPFDDGQLEVEGDIVFSLNICDYAVPLHPLLDSYTIKLIEDMVMSYKMKRFVRKEMPKND